MVIGFYMRANSFFSRYLMHKYSLLLALAGIVSHSSLSKNRFSQKIQWTDLVIKSGECATSKIRAAIKWNPR